MQPAGGTVGVEDVQLGSPTRHDSRHRWPQVRWHDNRATPPTPSGTEPRPVSCLLLHFALLKTKNKQVQIENNEKLDV